MKSFVTTLLIYILMLVQATAVFANNLNLPDLGDSGAAGVTAAEERRTGEAVMHNLRRAGLIVDDPLLTEYLNQLGYKLLAQYEGDTNRQFTFFLVNDDDINAFALPGGFIGINYGLVMASETESELASVLAHEIAHVTQRHYARAYDVSSQSSLPILAAMIAAIVLGSQGGGELGEAALATIAASNAQSQINFTRHNEEEADRIGIQMLASAGFNAEKMADFFDKLEQQSRLYGVNIPEFLRTHPVNSARISDARNRARLLPKSRPVDSDTYMLMLNRVLALAAKDKTSSEAAFREKLSDDKATNQAGIRYGYVLSLIENKKYSHAKTELDKLLKIHPHKIAYLLADAEISHKSGNKKRAYQIYQNALKLYPENAAITYDFAELLLTDQQYTRARTLLESFIKKTPDNPRFYKFLANSREKTGDSAGSHEAMAEYYYQIGQTYQAIDQINIALKDKKLDFYTTSRLEARLAHIKEEAPLEVN
jgi:predicted Zn-dependent protease